MRINKIIFPCTAIALLLFACGITPESVVENSPAAIKSHLAIIQQGNPNLSKMNKAVDDIFLSKGKEYASSLKQNCSEEELKVLEQLNSCAASAKDEDALEKCDEAHKLSKGNCKKASRKILKEVMAKALEANI